MEPEREIKRAFREHKDNERSTEITTTLMMFSRAGATGMPGPISWSSTWRRTRPCPRSPTSRSPTAARRRYFAENVTAPAGQPVRRMDCLDCHNRPAHTLSATPAQVVDRAIVQGEISTKIPFVRSQMVEALSEEHPAGTDASQAIVDRLTKVFGTSTPEARQTVQVARRLYRENVFPRMKVT